MNQDQDQDQDQEMNLLNEKRNSHDRTNNVGVNHNHLVEKTKHDKSYRNSLDLELINEKYDIEKVIRRPSILPKSPTITSEDFDEYSNLFRDMPLTDETTCGVWFIKGSFLQKFANKKVFVLLYGLIGCINAATFAYFNGTITTLEKRYKIPSRTTGLISVGNDISQIFISVFLSYYAGKGHRPRWLALGMFTVFIFCIMTALPHALYGPGEDALQLTQEYGGSHDANLTRLVFEKQKRKTLCQLESDEHCEDESGFLYPQIILFVAQFIGGVGGSLYFSLGVSYMDDNIQKSKTPVLISFSYFLRMLGPAIGYGLASFCLKVYISPTLTPTISMNDPRWLGAWWLGWLILSGILAVLSILIALFPKTLPRAAVRRAIAIEKNQGKPLEDDTPPSFKDMLKTIKRLLKNKTYVCNNLASIFYCIGYTPYWIFMPKYIETQFKQSASVASFVSGAVGLVFSAIGVLSSGIVISKLKPSARWLAGWNVFIGVVSVVGIMSYIYLGCDTQQNSGLSAITPCNEDCHCGYVPYTPICSETSQTFISPCHAGCKDSFARNDTKIYTDCTCISRSNTSSTMYENPFLEPSDSMFGSAKAGSCPQDCLSHFYIFLAIGCVVKFVGATGRSSNFLVGVRCIDEKDKPASMGFSVTVLSLFAFVPSPIFFGHILDTTCLVWGKTCTGKGNCWLYDGYQLRYLLSILAASLVSVGTLFDVGVWYYVKNLKIFDDDTKIKAVGPGSAGD